ncbi:unnamed protein product [Amoebophrya sp. A25]|nr:unnamed protein product [Amoebophrya sp. A25]|eukprot:GSA25T00000331001.1
MNNLSGASSGQGRIGGPVLVPKAPDHFSDETVSTESSLSAYNGYKSFNSNRYDKNCSAGASSAAPYDHSGDKSQHFVQQHEYDYYGGKNYNNVDGDYDNSNKQGDIYDTVPRVEKDLCTFVWDIIVAHLLRNPAGRFADPQLPYGYDPNFQAPLFVTWNKWAGPYENLRGCIGCLEPLSLDPGLKDYAFKAAFEDSRFSPIEANELSSLTCQVSVLHSFEECRHCYEWVVGKHGLIINFTCPMTGRKHSATYLPEVAAEHEMSRETAIEELCKKSGYRKAIDQSLLDSMSVTRYQSIRVKMDAQEYQNQTGADFRRQFSSNK